VRFLIHGLNYAPELTGIGKYTGQMAEFLSAQGHAVVVITTPPYYPHWRVQKPYRWWLYKFERLNGVFVIRCPLWVPNVPSGLKRLFHLFSFFLSSIPVFGLMMAWRPRVVMAIEPSFFSAICVAVLAPLFRFKSWLHVQDLELDAAFSLGLARGSFLQSMLQTVERHVMRLFHTVSSISGSMVKRLIQKGVNEGKVVLFPNWADEVSGVSIEKTALFREQWCIPPMAHVVLYSGNMGAKQGLETLLEAAVLLSNRRDIFFLFVGDGAARAPLQAMALNKQLNCVKFFPLQSTDLFPTVLAMADVHVVLQRKGAADLVMPSKLVNILACGGVCVVTAEPGTELYEVVETQQLGVVVPPQSSFDLKQALLNILNNPEKKKFYAARAQRYAQEHLDKKIILNEFEKKLVRPISPAC
jgi:colanic acid biosynthesis glycosyl transferase WcaI